MPRITTYNKLLTNSSGKVVSGCLTFCGNVFTISVPFQGLKYHALDSKFFSPNHSIYRYLILYGILAAVWHQVFVAKLQFNFTVVNSQNISWEGLWDAIYMVTGFQTIIDQRFRYRSFKSFFQVFPLQKEFSSVKEAPFSCKIRIANLFCRKP